MPVAADMDAVLIYQTVVKFKEICYGEIFILRQSETIRFTK